MKIHHRYSTQAYLLSLLALFLVAMAGKKEVTQHDARIYAPKRDHSSLLKKFHLKATDGNGKYIDVSISEEKLDKIRSYGYKVVLISKYRRNLSLPRAYKSYHEIENELMDLQAKYPHLVFVEKIGNTTELDIPIWGVRLSDNAHEKEDEPRILFAGVHHAREPIGANICLEIIKSMCKNYGIDKNTTTWINSLEIWFVPVINPDGYKYVMETGLRFPWWRKNLRDNDGDGIFNPLYDGVDLNRNYDYNWHEGGEGRPGSWFFRGRMPFSENETRALLKLARRENFTIGVSYHSYGESVLFPWGNYRTPPDIHLIVDVAKKMASRMNRQSGHGHYSILPLDGRVGQSSIWMYGHLRIIDFIVEVGTEYFPSDESIPKILEANLKGAYSLFERMLDSGIRGHIYDDITGEPLLAEIDVKGFSSDYVQPRRTGTRFGSFHQLLDPGEYTIEFRSEGYLPKLLKNIRVRSVVNTSLEVGLRKHKRLTNGRVAGKKK